MQEPAEGQESRAEGETQLAAAEEVAPPALAVSVDDFSALEERVLRAVGMLKHERQARASAEVRIADAEGRATQAEERLEKLQSQVQVQTPLIEQLQEEIDQLRGERDAVRRRVERLLEQLDSLEI